jgi:hypothetical protein
MLRLVLRGRVIAEGVTGFIIERESGENSPNEPEITVTRIGK